MESGSRYLKRFHHRVGCMSIISLMLPILFWVWQAAREPVVSVFNGNVPYYILSGKPFVEKFNIIHAGFVLDQPTIGKWLFWFSVMAATSLPYTAVVGWLADRRKTSSRLLLCMSMGVLYVFLMCILCWPLVWLIQYVCDMGFTPKRVFGLAYSIGWGLVLTGFMGWHINKVFERKPDQEELS